MSALALGIYSIVPLKSNRKIFPEGIEIQLKEYEKGIDAEIKILKNILK